MPDARDDQQFTLYESGVGIDNVYRVEPGVCVLPLAEEPPTDPIELADWSPVVVLRLHAPYRIRTARYRTRKQQGPPVLPSPSDTGAFVFTGGSLVFAAPVLNQSMQFFDWGCATEYTFVENCASRVEDGFVLGIGPFTTQSQQDNLRIFGVPPPAGAVGAILSAGDDAKIGYYQGTVAGAVVSAGQNIATSVLGGGLWAYNTQSFFPGTLFNDDLLNAGPPAVGSPHDDSGDGSLG